MAIWSMARFGKVNWLFLILDVIILLIKSGSFLWDYLNQNGKAVMKKKP